MVIIYTVAHISGLAQFLNIGPLMLLSPQHGTSYLKIYAQMLQLDWILQSEFLYQTVWISVLHL